MYHKLLALNWEQVNIAPNARTGQIRRLRAEYTTLAIAHALTEAARVALLLSRAAGGAFSSFW